MSAKYAIENVFKQLAASVPDDVEATAFSGDILNHTSSTRYQDSRGKEYGYYEVRNVPGGKKVEYFADNDGEILYGYTCYVPNEDWNVFMSEHGLNM